MKRTELGMCSSVTQTGKANDSRNSSEGSQLNEKHRNGNENF